MNNFNITVRDSVVENIGNQNVITAKKSATNRTMYRVTLELRGNDLPFVKKVTYRLHKTFKNRIKRVARTLSNPNCKLVFYAWGTFTVSVKIETLRGEYFKIDHPLQFGGEIISGNYPIKY